MKPIAIKILAHANTHLRWDRRRTLYCLGATVPNDLQPCHLRLVEALANHFKARLEHAHILSPAQATRKVVHPALPPTELLEALDRLRVRWEPSLHGPVVPGTGGHATLAWRLTLPDLGGTLTQLPDPEPLGGAWVWRLEAGRQVVERPLHWWEGRASVLSVAVCAARSSHSAEAVA